jgi:hypothetical protein
MRADVASWLAGSVADANARGLEDLVPLLETLARSLEALRDADHTFAHPAMPQDDDSAAR